MKPITMEQVLKTFKEYFLMTVGMMLYSFAWIGCIMPADGTGGGATGLSRVLCHAVEHWAGISIQIGTMAFLINGVLLLVDAFEGCMPQTRFVLQKALENERNAGILPPGE
mgnify:CR=1 FL=1